MGGAKMVLMRKWDLEEGLRLARAEQITGFGGVPTVARQILERARRRRARPRHPDLPDGWCAGSARPPAPRDRGLRRRHPDPERLRPDRDDVRGRDERRRGVRDASRQRRATQPHRRRARRRCRGHDRSESARSARSASDRRRSCKGYWNDDDGDERHRSTTAGSTRATSATSTPTASCTSSTA